MSQLPTAHIEEAQKIENVEEYVDLYELALIDGGSVFFKEKQSITWQGDIYESLPFKLGADGKSSENITKKIKFILYQTEGLFNPFAFDGLIEGSILTKKRVLGEHINSDTNIFQEHRWLVSRIVSMVGDIITFELRKLSDGPNAVIPAKRYNAPTYPSVVW